MGSILVPIESLDRWQHRAVRETGGNKTVLGMFVLAILGWQNGRKPPRFGKVAKIDSEGMVFSNAQDAGGRMFKNECLGPVQNIIDSFKGLADHLKLSDDERVEMFAELRKWFVIDERANQSNEERGLNL